jgi:hypothetical protein
MAAGGPAGGGAAVEALAGFIAREGVAGVHDVLEHLEGRDRIPRVFGEARGQEGVAGGGGGDLVAAVVGCLVQQSPNQVFYNTKVIKINAYTY